MNFYRPLCCRVTALAELYCRIGGPLIKVCSDTVSAFEQDLQEIGMSTSSITPKSLNARNFFNLDCKIGMFYLKNFQIDYQVPIK